MYSALKDTAWETYHSALSGLRRSKESRRNNTVRSVCLTSHLIWIHPSLVSSPPAFNERVRGARARRASWAAASKQWRAVLALALNVYCHFFFSYPLKCLTSIDNNLAKLLLLLCARTTNLFLWNTTLCWCNNYSVRTKYNFWGNEILMCGHKRNTSSWLNTNFLSQNKYDTSNTHFFRL